MLRKTLYIIALIAAVIVINLLSSLAFFRLDLTQEKRYTLTPLTRDFLARAEHEIFVHNYLAGDLNSGFARLSRSAEEMLDEFRVYAHRGLMHSTVDVSEMNSADTEHFMEELEAEGLAGVPVFETAEDGRKTRTVVYPYLKIQAGEHYLWVNLLENKPGTSASENLNSSVENLEYKIVDGLRTLLTDELPRIAFLEGHGCLDEIDVIEATDALSQYFAVDRGAIADDASVLDAYKVIIVAKPSAKFSEKDKYVLDQYIMRGGRVLWLVDAVTMTLDSMRHSPHTVGLLADFNLDDQLFIYGVRINPEVVEDINCGMVAVSVAQPGEGTQLVPMPWRFAPLLATNRLSPVTRNVSPVKTDFAGHIDTVGEDLAVHRVPLLCTSAYTKVDRTPVYATLEDIHRQPQRSEFNRQNLIVGLLEEGVFTSAFAHRRTPDGLTRGVSRTIAQSLPTKMIFVADGDIIRNDVRFRQAQNPTIVPLGYDELSRQTFGNKDFIVNAVQYLADDEGWMQLRNRTFALRLLDREKLGADTLPWKVTAIALPIALVCLCGVAVVFVRSRRYGKHASKR